jgi:VanZ family protein
MISVTAYRAIFWLLLALVAILSMVSIELPSQIFIWQDKLQHLLAYAVLCWFLLCAYEKQHKLWILAILLAVFSSLVEVAQSYAGSRQADVMDLMANCLGILLVALTHSLRGRV